MGWLWTDSSTKASTVTKSFVDPLAAPDISTPSSSTPIPPSSDTQRAPTRDELADAEFRAFLQELSSGDASSLSSAPSTADTLDASACAPSTDADPNSIDPVALLPTTLSCRTTFDDAYFCQSMGGQLASVYRYGELRDCSERWSDFWFCMRTMNSGLGEEASAKAVKERWGAKMKRLRTKGRTSEDVWRIRDTVVGAEEGRCEMDLEDVWPRLTPEVKKDELRIKARGGKSA